MGSEYTPTAALFLLSLIPLTIYFVSVKRAPQAVLWISFYANLFGPEGSWFKLPLVPPLDKLTLPFSLLFLAALVKWRPKLRAAKLFRGTDLLVLLALVGGFITMATNTDDLTYGRYIQISLPGLVINDGIRLGFDELLRVGFPFLLGRALFRTERDLRDLLHFLIVAGLLQTLFIFVELRLSPQWHNWVYGYGAHSDFLQTIRWGGYRPMNFTPHGLALAMFMAISFLSTIVFFKVGLPVRKWSAKRVAIYLGVVLVLCKSTGAIVYGVLFAPLLLRVSPKRQVQIAGWMGGLIAVYPLARAFGWVPTEKLVQFATDVFGEDRAQSLGFRFDNEELLLAKSREHLWFGWGGHGRRSIYNDYAQEATIADGYWIIVFGTRGVVGLVQAFGLLLIPIFAIRRVFSKLTDPTSRQLIAGFTLILAVAVLDLLPNGLFLNYTYLLSGALLGFAQEIKKRPGSWVPAPAPRFRTRRR